MKHTMNLNPRPFLAIKSGTKTIEIRLYDEKRQKLNVGDSIEFTNREDNELLLVDIINLHIFKNFEDLYSKFDKISIGYNEEEIANPKDMNQYYSVEDIKKYGVVGIEITVHIKEQKI